MSRLLSILSILLIISCSGESIEPINKSGIAVSIVLSTSDDFSVISHNSKGTDSYINGSSISMFVYDVDGNFKDRAEIKSVSPSDNGRTCTVDALLHNISEEDCNVCYRVVFIANTNGKYCSFDNNLDCCFDSSVDSNLDSSVDCCFDPAHLSLEQLYENLIFYHGIGYDCVDEFTQCVFSGDTTNGIIPLWGTSTVEFSNNCTFEVSMLRSLALIKVYAASSSMNIERVELCGGTCRGYIAPLNAISMLTTSAPGYKSVNVPEAFVEEISIRSSFYKYEEAFYLYLPEQLAGTCSINILANGKNYSMPINDYSTNTPLPITRNTIYSYSLELSSARSNGAERICGFFCL